jgi:YesN/AraC family two-component response regulator
MQSDKDAIKFDIQLKKDKAYLESDFDLAAMAKSMNIQATKLSKLIKKYYGISFAEYINRLRIHNFLLQRDSFDQYTLETYMYQSGFANRSTFYAAFKKYVGVNPSFYLKEMSIDQTDI